MKLKTIIPESKIGKLINKFFNTPYYFILVGLLITISNLFALEIVCYTILFLITITISIVSEDNKPLFLIYLFFNLAMSYKNGPIYSSGGPSIYQNEALMIYFYVLLGIILLSFVYHFVIYQDYLKFKKFKRGKYLLIGLAVLFVVHLLGGLGSSYYIPNNLIYNLYLFGTIIISLFYIFVSSFNDGTDPIKYFINIAVTFLVIMIIELINIYITQGVVVNGTIQKYRIVTGWGVQNNFGGYMCMLIPFITYAAKKYKYGFLYTLFLIVISIAIILTGSRTSILFAFVAIIFSFVYLIIPERKKWNIPNIITISATAILSLILILVFSNTLKELFNNLLNYGLSDNGRYEQWDIGKQLFLEYPFLGTGWFSLDPFMSTVTGVYTPKWLFHNIIIQYLASCGVVGLLCFIFFLGTLCFQGFRYPTERRFILMSSLALLLGMSLLDIFFFNYTFIRGYSLILGILIVEPNAKEIRTLSLSTSL